MLNYIQKRTCLIDSFDLCQIRSREPCKYFIQINPNNCEPINEQHKNVLMLWIHWSPRALISLQSLLTVPLAWGNQYTLYLCMFPFLYIHDCKFVICVLISRLHEEMVLNTCHILNGYQNIINQQVWKTFSFSRKIYPFTIVWDFGVSWAILASTEPEK